MIKRRWVPILLGLMVPWFLGSAFAQQTPPRLPCALKDLSCIDNAVRRHPVRHIDFWQSARNKPLDERLGQAPNALVEYLTLDNIQSNFPDRPRGVTPDAALMNDVRAAIQELPRSVWALFGTRLLGIYFVEGLGGTGYTDVVFDSAEQPVAGYIVLDLGLLRLHTANGWASWKESTPFSWHRDYRLQAQLEHPDHDNRKNAIQYILLHELAHVLSIGNTVHPPWTQQRLTQGAAPRYAFFELSWQKDRKSEAYASLFDSQFKQRQRIAYYVGAKLSADDMLGVYSDLEKTNFTSLYAATSPGDDFAEAFASYVHVVMMKRPWQITISRQGKVLKVFKSCWDEPRCAAKRASLDAMLQ